jgi:glycosyltransferase involved in cell wall biosynthesis
MAAERAPGASGARLGYLLSHYPSANHTYLVREVRALRAAGVPVEVVTVDADARPAEALTPAERDERARAYVVKRAGVAGILWAHAATLAAHPVRYAAGCAAAVRLAGADLTRLAYHLFYFAEAVVAGRRLWRAGCTHVHTHYATTVAVIAARVFPFRLSASIHGSAEFIDPRAQRLREKIAACDFVRTISLYGRSQLMLASQPEEWGKFFVARLGVDAGEFAPAPRPGRAGPFRLVSVGQLQPAKGFPVLLDALAALVRGGRDVALTIVGGGAGRADLEAQAARLGVGERVTFTGPLNQHEVRAVLADADCFVLASFAEGIPVVLMEAMAAGVPCVATRITGIPELIEDGVSGLLVTASDEAALAAAVARLADDAGLRARIAAAGLATIRRDYDLTANVGQLVREFAARIPGAALRARSDA